MARSQLLLAVTRLPPAAAATARARLTSAALVHSRCQDSSSVKSMRAAVSQHSDTVEPPSWAAANSLMNSSERSSRSGHQIHPSGFSSYLITGAAFSRERRSRGARSRQSITGNDASDIRNK